MEIGIAVGLLVSAVIPLAGMLIIFKRDTGKDALARCQSECERLTSRCRELEDQNVMWMRKALELGGGAK